MTPEATVKKRFPFAQIEFQKAVHEAGQLSPIQAPQWEVFAEQAIGHSPIGIGASRELAWQNAAEKVKRDEKTERAQRWVEYLLKKGFGQDGNRLIDPKDSDRHAIFDLPNGLFLPSEKLRPELVSDSQGNPPKE